MAMTVIRRNKMQMFPRIKRVIKNIKKLIYNCITYIPSIDMDCPRMMKLPVEARTALKSPADSNETTTFRG